MECGLSTDENTFQKLYAPEYITHNMTKQNFLNLNKKALCFDWFAKGFSFVSGSVSCTGVEMVFKNDWFEEISVRPMYDYKKGNLYNTVLAKPKYTEKDWQGRKKISQSAHIVRSEKDLDRYFKKLFNKFECPLLS